MSEMVDIILDIMQSRGLMADEADARAVIAAMREPAHWIPIDTFDPRFGDKNALYLIAGVYPNGLRWVECCYWDPRGYFAGHKMDTFRPKWWRPMPEPPEE